MNDYVKYGLFFAGGLALGLLGAAVLGRNGVKPLATDLLSRGLDLKDTVMGTVDTLREGAQDLLAEAQQAAEQRREAADKA